MHQLSNKAQILFWCWNEPDRAAGSSMVLNELIKQLPADLVTVVCEENTPKPKRKKIEYKGKLYRLKLPSKYFPIKSYRLQRLFEKLDERFLIQYAKTLIKRTRPTIIVSIYYRPLWIKTAKLTSEREGIPVFWYVHDPLEEVAQVKLREHLSRLEIKTISQDAAVVLNDSLKKLYKEKYDRDFPVVRHMLPGLNQLSPTTVSKNLIGFSGAIYDHNVCQIRELAKICNQANWQLTIWSDVSWEYLESNGVPRKGVKLLFESDYNILLESLNKCTILYLPLAFPTYGGLNYSYAFPTKTVDYLQTTRPILIHAPEYFEVTQFFSNYPDHIKVTNAALKSEFDHLVQLDLSQKHLNNLSVLEQFSVEKNLNTFISEMNIQSNRI